MELSKVTFSVVGKVFDPLRLGEKLKATALGTVKYGFPSKIEVVHCIVHNQNAKAVLKETAEGKLNYEIQGCCNELLEEVKRLLGVA